MTDEQLAGLVVKQLEAFFVLQELNHLRELGIGCAVNTLKKIYASRSVDPGAVPFFEMNTAFAFLAPALRLIQANPRFETTQERHGISLFENERELASPEATQVVATAGNALAHFFESTDGGPNVEFDGGKVVVFRSRRYRLEFRTEDGFVNFVTDVRKSARARANELLSERRVP